MYNNKWFPILPSAEVPQLIPGKPIPTLRLSLHLVERKQVGTMGLIQLIPVKQYSVNYGPTDVYRSVKAGEIIRVAGRVGKEFV